MLLPILSLLPPLPLPIPIPPSRRPKKEEPKENEKLTIPAKQAGTAPTSPSPSTDPIKARESYCLQHCLPTIPQIVSKLYTLRASYPSLRRVYVLSNGWGWWLDALQQDVWDDLKSNLDVQLDGEQAYVAMAVDMAIAEKAEVFVGNEVSFFLLSLFPLSLSSPRHL
jgi:hypothetical protein